MRTYITRPGQHWANRTTAGVVVMRLHMALVEAHRYPLPPWKRRTKVDFPARR